MLVPGFLVDVRKTDIRGGNFDTLKEDRKNRSRMVLRSAFLLLDVVHCTKYKQPISVQYFIQDLYIFCGVLPTNVSNDYLELSFY